MRTVRRKDPIEELAFVKQTKRFPSVHGVNEVVFQSQKAKSLGSVSIMPNNVPVVVTGIHMGNVG
jgi:hypothetical protein